MNMHIKPDDLESQVESGASSSPSSERMNEQSAEPEQAHVKLRQRKPRVARKPEEAKATTPKEGITRQRGSISFPWYDLDVAIAVARAILDGGGLPFTRDQLAGALRIAPTGGNFILKTSAARMFGLIELVQSKFQLTPLGFSILAKEEATEKAARVDAFLSVPLFKRAYDEFRGKPLPPRPHGLESAFTQMGVPSKSRKAARQVFERSARQGGFFNVDPDRLIEPVIANGGATERQTPGTASGEANARAQASEAAAPNSAVSFELDELLRGLLRRLPKTGESWDADQKAKWLNTLSQNLDYVVPLKGDDKKVTVEVKSEVKGS